LYTGRADSFFNLLVRWCVAGIVICLFICDAVERSRTAQETVETHRLSDLVLVMGCYIVYVGCLHFGRGYEYDV